MRSYVVYSEDCDHINNKKNGKHFLIVVAVWIDKQTPIFLINDPTFTQGNLCGS